MKYEGSSLFFSRNCGLSGRSCILPAFEMSDEKEKSGALLLIQSSPVLQEKRFLLFAFFLRDSEEIGEGNAHHPADSLNLVEGRIEVFLIPGGDRGLGNSAQLRELIDTKPPELSKLRDAGENVEILGIQIRVHGGLPEAIAVSR